MTRWRTGISIALLLTLFMAPLLQAATMNSAMAMGHGTVTENPAASQGHVHIHPPLDTDPVAHAPASREAAGHLHHASSDTDSDRTDSCHGDPGSMDCCTLCGSCGIPVTSHQASQNTRELQSALASNPPEPLLATRKRPPRKTS